MPHATARLRNLGKFLANFFEEICARLPVSRPGGWVALWRRMGNISVLDCGAGG